MFLQRLRTYTTITALGFAALPTGADAQYAIREFPDEMIECADKDGKPLSNEALGAEIARTLNEVLARSRAAGIEGLREQDVDPSRFVPQMLDYVRANGSISINIGATPGNRGPRLVCKQRDMVPSQ